MQTDWVVLANASRARVLGRDADDGSLVELAEFDHPQSRMKNSESGRDQPGHVERGLGEVSKGSTGHGSTQYEPKTDPRHKEHERFARELAAYVDEAVTQHRCETWVLCASNPFLGEFKAHLTTAGADALRRTVVRDLTAFTGRELARHLKDALAPPR